MITRPVPSVTDKRARATRTRDEDTAYRSGGGQFRKIRKRSLPIADSTSTQKLISIYGAQASVRWLSIAARGRFSPHRSATRISSTDRPTHRPTGFGTYSSPVSNANRQHPRVNRRRPRDARIIPRNHWKTTGEQNSRGKRSIVVNVSFPKRNRYCSFLAVEGIIGEMGLSTRGWVDETARTT